MTDRTTDPENVTELRKADLVETEVDEVSDDERPPPLEADPADVAEQRRVDSDADDDERDTEFEF